MITITEKMTMLTTKEVKKPDREFDALPGSSLWSKLASRRVVVNDSTYRTAEQPVRGTDVIGHDGIDSRVEIGNLRRVEVEVEVEVGTCKGGTMCRPRVYGMGKRKRRKKGKK